LRSAKSSTATTRTVSTGGSGSARTSRSRVSLATGSPSRAASRTPARAAIDTATDVNILRNSDVNRACGLVNPSTCSANVTAAHAAFTHLNRRTVKASTVVIPPSAPSASRRT
jgi:hypothetical protein